MEIEPNYKHSEPETQPICGKAFVGYTKPYRVAAKIVKAVLILHFKVGALLGLTKGERVTLLSLESRLLYISITRHHRVY